MRRRIQTIAVAGALALLAASCGGSSSTMDFTRKRNAALCDQDELAALKEAAKASQEAFEKADAERTDAIEKLYFATIDNERNNAGIDLAPLQAAADEKNGPVWPLLDQLRFDNNKVAELQAVCDAQGSTDTVAPSDDTTPAGDGGNVITSGDTAVPVAAEQDPESKHEVKVTLYPAEPVVGDAVWIGAETDCVVPQYYWLASSARYEQFEGAPNHQPFVPSQGETYKLAVWGTCENGDEVKATVEVPVKAAVAPTNDNFADAAVIKGVQGTYSNTSLGATWEEGEDKHTGCTWEADLSVWMKWVAPASGRVTLSLESAFAVPVYMVMTGDSAASVTPVDAQWLPEWAGQQFDATKGTTYYVLVSGCYRQGFGSYTLKWSTEGAEESTTDTTVTDDTATAGSPDVTTAVVPEEQINYAIGRENFTVTSEPNVVEVAVPETAQSITLTDETQKAILEMAGATEGSIYVSVGGGMLVPVTSENRTVYLDKGTKALHISVQSKDTVSRELTLTLVKKPVAEVPASSSDSGGSSISIMYIVIALVALVIVAGAVLVRRRKPAAD